MIMRRQDEGVEVMRRALAVDPLSPVINGYIIHWLGHANRLEEAEEEYRRVGPLYPGYWLIPYVMAFISWQKDEGDLTISRFEQAVGMTGGNAFNEALLAGAHFAFGRTERGEELLAALERKAETAWVPPSGFVIIHLARRDTDEAIRWLERARVERDALFPWMRRVCENIPTLRDERFIEACASFGLP